MKLIKNFIAILLIFIAINTVFFSSLMIYVDKAGPLNKEKILILPRNNSIKQISNILSKNNIIDHPKIFSIIAKIISYKYPLKSGEYKFTINISIKSIINILTKGKSVIHKLTIVEGLTTSQIIKIINQEELLFGEINSISGEGELLPETYFFAYGDSKQLLINRMQNKMQAYLSKAWEERDPNLPINNMLEALTLASIVEKETSNKFERARVAAVFINRLRKKMKLQADPTTIYALTLGKIDFGRALTKKDLLIKSEFNTYYTNGLPPRPICNPSKASIYAVLHPQKTDELYFVVDGVGGHKFSNNYADHQKNVSNYRKTFLAK